MCATWSWSIKLLCIITNVPVAAAPILFIFIFIEVALHTSSRLRCQFSDAILASLREVKQEARRQGFSLNSLHEYCPSLLPSKMFLHLPEYLFLISLLPSPSPSQFFSILNPVAQFPPLFQKLQSLLCRYLPLFLLAQLIAQDKLSTFPSAPQTSVPSSLPHKKTFVSQISSNNHFRNSEISKTNHDPR